jgi:Zn-dependent protease with chaperone function
MPTVAISKDFKQGATRAILSIVLFVLVYLLLIIAAVGLTVACGYAGIKIIILKPSLLTLMLGIGLLSMGLLIIIFLIKFIFTSTKTDSSHLIEITKAEEPQLFAFIEDIVKQVNTNFPKKVYISSEVNASVFYDSGFWSMFLPVKKNLHIGLGLMNAVTVDEFKAILAHEFGHFSQRSMKVGSYVYNVNYIIHNMLNDNTSYNNLISRWASVSGYFSIFVAGGIKIISGIQWVLGRVYNVVNINYLALSREMEFHADEIAAHVAGPQALATSLVRLDLASSSLSTVLDFYELKIPENIKPQNIFPQQYYAMNQSANEFGIAFEHDLPMVTLSTMSRFNKSKLSFSDQWSSHPSNEDRIKKLESLDIKIQNTNNSPALNLFIDKEKVQAKVTEQLFANITYLGEISWHAQDDFANEFLATRQKNTLPKKYNNFYDDQSFLPIDFNELKLRPVKEVNESELFSNEAVDIVYESIGLESDIKIIKQIANGDTAIKSFDYDNLRYSVGSGAMLVAPLERKLEEMKISVVEMNKDIYAYYYNIARNNGKAPDYESKYASYDCYNKIMDTEIAVVNEMYELTSFLNETHQFEVIKVKMEKVYNKEKEFKEKIKVLLENTAYNTTTNRDVDDVFANYLSKNRVYFSVDEYYNDELRILFDALNCYTIAVNRLLFNLKKDFLDFQSTLTA